MQYEKGAFQKALIVILTATTCYCLMEYHSPFHNRTWDGLLFYFAIPLVTIVLIKENPFQWGLGIGRWQWTLGLTLAGALGSALLLLVAVRLPVFQRYYERLGPQTGKLWPWIGFLALDMFAWEYLFRSYMLFGLEPALGDMAIYVQMIPFAIAHIGKPEIETLSSIVGGILVGYIVRRSRSFWPAYVLHMIIGTTMYLL
jgi:membrane protease YdiL (CAAX protease family)